MQNNIIEASIWLLGKLKIKPQLLFIRAAGTPFCDHVFCLPRITFEAGLCFPLRQPLFYFFLQDLSVFLFYISVPLLHSAFGAHGKDNVLILNLEAVLLIIRLKDKEVLFSPDIHRLARNILSLRCPRLILKLRNIQLGYTVPAVISKKTRMDRLRFYCSAQNLLTIKSKNFTGEDPENPNFSYPIPVNITFGLNIGF